MNNKDIVYGMCIHGNNMANCQDCKPLFLPEKVIFKPCGEVDNICNCKNEKECGYIKNETDG